MAKGKKERTQARRKSVRPERSRVGGRRLLPAGMGVVVAIFVVALAVRVAYLVELREAPFFGNPVGDSRLYHERAVEIAAGDLIGREAYFHSSPLYPYFLAVIYKLFGAGFLVARLIQILIGSANSVIVYYLARKLSGTGRGPPTLAGLMAAFYGTLIFFDGDLLMITLVLFFSSSSVLLLSIGDEWLRNNGPEAGVRPHGRTRAVVVFFVAGVLLGWAGLGKPNVLLFAPVGLLWIFTGFQKTLLRDRWKAGLLFTLGAVLAIAPITIRNYIVSKDLVLVSSNAGVNLYIGNNPEASGVFYLPPLSGLDNIRLYLSSRAAAEKATGEADLKPSEVSRYWISETLDFVESDPVGAVKLLTRKFFLFWNHYEIPNHHNLYFVRTYYAPVLRLFAVGFWLVAPLSILGIVLLAMKGGKPRIRWLYLAFVVVYMGSLIPFFITARYRLPVVPFLIVFASVGIFEAADLMRRRSFKRLSVAVVAGLVAAAVVGRFIVDYDFGFSHTVMGTAYSELATKEPDKAPGHIEKAVIEFKKALELTPLSVDAHYNLGVVYQRVGYFSGAVERLEAAAALKPDHTYAAKALRESRLSLEETGDKINPKVLPRTPFEAGLEYTLSGMEGAAERQYKRVLKEDPHHPGAYSQLGAISFQRKEYGEAIAYFKTGLKYRPDHFVLNNNLAGAYYRAGEYGKARRHWEKCLTTQPGNESVLEQLRMLESK